MMWFSTVRAVVNTLCMTVAESYSRRGRVRVYGVPRRARAVVYSAIAGGYIMQISCDYWIFAGSAERGHLTFLSHLSAGVAYRRESVCRLQSENAEQLNSAVTEDAGLL